MKCAAGLRELSCEGTAPTPRSALRVAMAARAASSLAPVALRCCVRLRPPYTISGAWAGVATAAVERTGTRTAEVAAEAPTMIASASVLTARRA